MDVASSYSGCISYSINDCKTSKHRWLATEDVVDVVDVASTIEAMKQ